MKTIRLILICLLTIAATAIRAQRIKTTINDTWRFAMQETSAASVDFDDAAWETISIPHTWNALDTDDETPGYARGKGWYRRRIKIDDLLPGQRVGIHFEGANQVTVLYVNGHRVGNHTGGYTAFAFDITEYIHPGDNLFAIEVDNAHNPDIPPLSADYTFYGGKIGRAHV